MMLNEAEKIVINDWAHYDTSRDDALENKPKKKKWSGLVWLSATLFISILVLFSTANGESSRNVEKINAKIPDSFPSALNPFPGITAHAYLVKILGKDMVLARQREWKKLPPASLTKLLTTLLAYENLNNVKNAIFSSDALAVEEKTSGATAGEEFSIEDIISFALIPSANDAARLLAEKIGEKYGGADFDEKIGVFLALINRKAEDIGLLNSHFSNPAGLDADDHFSTAENLALLSEYIWYNHPKIWELSRTIEKTVISATGKEYRIENTDKLLKEFPGILGGKTGFTDNAKETLILLYPVRAEDVAVIVILGSDDRFGDGKKIIQWLEKSF